MGQEAMHQKGTGGGPSLDIEYNTWQEMIRRSLSITTVRGLPGARDSGAATIAHHAEPSVTRIQTFMPPPPPPVFRQPQEQYAPRHEHGWIASVEDPGVMPPPLPYDPWQDSWPEEYPPFGFEGEPRQPQRVHVFTPPQHNLMAVRDFTHRQCHRKCQLDRLSGHTLVISGTINQP
ncbi:uncharacterized protein LOC128655511 isoform X1 [Bombina bombina]|uniref:uncharacterized protein LOC128655511 isoform X1 n=1 Tax=Bombina bombina TaxID=8345 RepID=UPI00235AC265|nr:uncharacterized protein LOC128655511 isoform X1 [Bombina bombina]XP_053565092.1 uncharacterized protein LOC128655511 isoform X1 [Bombina bombina]